MIRLFDLAHARSGDKGHSVNIALIAYTSVGYKYLRDIVTAKSVQTYFSTLCHHPVVCYDLPDLKAFNFILPHVLGDGAGSLLTTDLQGKTLGTLLLDMPLQKPPLFDQMIRRDLF